MFPLFHDRTRRLLCRSLFLLLGVLPTGVVLAWSIVVNGEGHRAAMCQQLSREFGCDVRIRSLSHKRQEITLLEGFELVDPETAAVLLSSPQVEIREDEQATSVKAIKADLTFTGRNWWQSALDRRLQLSRQRQRPLSLRIDEIALAWPQGKQVLRDFTVDFNSFDQGNIAEVKFHLGGESAAKPIELRFQRTSDPRQPISSFELNTGSNSLHCSLLATTMSEENPFGSASTFRGTLRANDGPDGWRMQIDNGFVEQVDLNVLASRHFPGQCAGTAEIHFRSALFHRGWAEQMECAIKAGPGTISLETVRALAYFLRVQPSLDLAAEQPFDELAAELKLSSQGLIVGGQCQGMSGAMIRSGNKAVLSQPNWQLPRWGRW